MPIIRPNKAYRDRNAPARSRRFLAFRDAKLGGPSHYLWNRLQYCIKGLSVDPLRS